MNDLYVVSTYYHALIACVRHINDGGNAEIMVTDYIPNHTNLAEQIEKSGIFLHTHCLGRIEEYNPTSRLDYLINNARKNKKTIEKQLAVSFKEYKNIYVFHDDTWIAKYLKCAMIPYHLLEDGLDSYKTITKSPFAYMAHKDNLKAQFKNIFRVGYTYCGFDRFTKTVEVNSVDGVEIKHLAKNKLIERPRKPMFDSLTSTDMDLLKNIFLKDVPDFDDRHSVLLLTQPLFIDKTVESEVKQLEIYKNAVHRYIGEYKLIVKPHPRDTSDYSGFFSQAIILDKNMPLEILAMIKKPHFAKVLSIDSTCTYAVSADEYVRISIEDNE